MKEESVTKSYPRITPIVVKNELIKDLKIRIEYDEYYLLWRVNITKKRKKK